MNACDIPPVSPLLVPTGKTSVFPVGGSGPVPVFSDAGTRGVFGDESG